MNIWRISCKPGSQLVEHKESFKKWIEKEFVGIGWSKEENFLLGLENINISAHAIKEHIYESLKKSNYRTRSYITYTNILFNRMKKGDYIWTRCDGIYKLGTIIDENCLYNTYPNEDFIPNRYQIGFYRKVKWLKKDFVENEVPGKIIASFRNPSTLQKVYENKNELSLYCKINIENNSIHFPIADWKNLLSAEDIEEIVGLYLQIEKKLYIYTSTCKEDTSLIEFQLIDIKGNLYGVQVKSGNTNINADEYFDLSKKMKIFLFATNDNIYNLEKYKNIEKIESKEITFFIEKYLDILPKKVRFWFEK